MGLLILPMISEIATITKLKFAQNLENNLENKSKPSSFLDKWDIRWIRIAEEVRTWSKDPKRKVGCVLVRDKKIDISKGYNGFPEKIPDDLNRLKDPRFKDKVIIHAEENAIYHALDLGVPVRGCTAYVTYHPCSRCASMLIKVGIQKIVCPDHRAASEKWREDFSLSSDILYEAGVKVIYYDLETDVLPRGQV